MVNRDLVADGLEVLMAFLIGAFLFLAAGAFGAPRWLAWGLAAVAAILVLLGEP